MSTDQRTVACVLTPPGRGAVAVVGVDGPQAAEHVSRFFQPIGKRELAQQPINRIVYGHWIGSEVDAHAQAEDLVVCRRSDTRVEVHCHGGKQSSAQIVSDLMSVGCKEIDQHMWLQLEHGCPIRAAASEALAQATTARTAEVLLDQFHGALRQELEGILADLDDEKTEIAQQRIARLLEFAEFGLHLTKPWQVVIAGRPNVGKSSLINALVGFERAIVYDQPGTTRDVVTATTAVDGWPIQLSDTAGLHTTDDAIESAGIELARTRLLSADLIVWVLDATEVALIDEPKLLVQQQAEKVAVNLADDQIVIVLNKADLAGCNDHEDQSVTVTSAISRTGIDRLLNQLSTRLVPNPPPREQAVPFAQNQIESLRQAHQAAEKREVIRQLLGW